MYNIVCNFVTMRVSVLILFFIQFEFNLSETVPTATCNNKDSEIEGYYWRDFTGVIPKDALPGGVNSHGKVTYIGQVLHQNQLIPAKIDQEENKVTYEWSYLEYVAEKNIKILCTNNIDQFEWVNTGNQHINTIKDKNFVVGGYEAGIMKLLIGRKLIDGELVVGKVVFNKQSTLNTTKDGKGTQHATYQVLAYSPATKKRQSVQQNEQSCSECKLNKTIVINFYT